MKKFALSFVAALPALLASAGGLAVIGATTLGSSTPTAQACPIPSANIRVVSSQPMGFRGDTVTWTVELRGPNGQRLANVPINFSFRSDAHGARHISQGCTNSSGRATLTFRIPTSVNEDNVFLIARSVGNYPVSVDQRIAIGRRR